MNHFASSRFWACYDALPHHVRQLADKNFTLLKSDPHHPSLAFKRVHRFWSSRVGLEHRALAVEDGTDFVRFWIGDHRTYERMIR